MRTFFQGRILLGVSGHTWRLSTGTRGRGLTDREGCAQACSAEEAEHLSRPRAGKEQNKTQPHTFLSQPDQYCRRKRAVQTPLTTYRKQRRCLGRNPHTYSTWPEPEVLIPQHTPTITLPPAHLPFKPCCYVFCLVASSGPTNTKTNCSHRPVLLGLLQKACLIHWRFLPALKLVAWNSFFLAATLSPAIFSTLKITPSLHYLKFLQLLYFIL